jgi:hypothetical protein
MVIEILNAPMNNEYDRNTKLSEGTVLVVVSIFIKY